jgi:FixJ family two-component response regulator
MKTGQKWTQNEVRVLKTVFRGFSNSSVSMVLERSPKAVERKAAKLGLKKTKKYLRKLGRSV